MHTFEYISSCLSLSFLNKLATSGSKGSSGLGSDKREHIDKITLLTVKTGLHLSCNISAENENNDIKIHYLMESSLLD